MVLNIGAGEAGSKLDKAIKLLSSLSNQKPIATTSKKRIPTWGLRPGLTIGAKVTIRKNSEELLKNMFVAVNNSLDVNKIGEGEFSFGIAEYIHIPKAKYDAEIGIIGLGVMVVLERPGFRIKRRTYQKRSIPTRHKITKEETMEYLKTNFNIKFKEQ